MFDAIFPSDFGYNPRETISFVNERLGATGTSRNKRSLDYALVFGDGPITKRHKGIVVSERGCRAVYSATRTPSSNQGKPVQAFVYRESCSGKIAAVFHNNARLFGAPFHPHFRSWVPEL